MSNRYAGDGDAGPIEAFRDAGRDTYVERDEDTGEIRAGWAFPNLMDNEAEPTADSRRSLHWRFPIFVTVDAMEYGEALDLLTEKLTEAGIPFELE